MAAACALKAWFQVKHGFFSLKMEKLHGRVSISGATVNIQCLKIMANLGFEESEKTCHLVRRKGKLIWFQVYHFKQSQKN